MFATRYPDFKRTPEMYRRRYPKPFGRAQRRLRLWRGLTDAQWNEIIRLRPLPPKARKEIDVEIDIAQRRRELIKQRLPPSEMRKRLRHPLKAAFYLHDWLESSKLDPAINAALSQPFGPDDDHALHRASKRAAREPANIAQASQLTVINILERALKRTYESKLSRSADGLLDLIFQLDRILLKFTGKGFSRSKHNTDSEEFARFVCRLVDPKCGNGSIADAMKTVIRVRSRYRRAREHLACAR
jgi:hypothetical protein